MAAAKMCLHSLSPEVTRMYRNVLAVAFSLTTLLCGCTTLTVRSDVNASVIGQVRCNTYAWAGAFRGNSPLRNTIANPINENRLRAAIAQHLHMATTAGPADCLVGYGIGSTSGVDWAYYGGWGGWGYPYGWGWGGWGYPGPYVYREGIIAIDVYDARSGQPIWHASVDQSLFGADGAEAQKRIDTAVAALFSKFPPIGSG
jgi:Domain of unknown function (DUF4136)